MAKILGVRVDDVGESEALELAKGFLRDGKQYSIYTPNPEMLVAAHKNSLYKDVLNRGALNICDGRGAQLFGGLKNRIPGIEFMLLLCKMAAKEGKSVYFLGAGQGIVEKTSHELALQLPNLSILGCSAGPKLTHNGAGDSIKTISAINKAEPDILLVAFGHPKQENWIDKHLKDLPSVNIAMGVGGSFDFISGNKKRAPKWMQQIGFEWLYRLIQEPSRIKRIFTATVLFPLLILKSKV